MGFFKKIFSDAADELKKSIEDSKNEMRKSLEDMKRSAMADFGIGSSSNKADDDDDENNDEPRIKIGKLEDGVLTISEGFSELDDESLEEYKQLKKIVFPASLKSLGSDVICDQKKLEAVDFSKVTQLKEIPDEFVNGETRIKEFVIPQGVTMVGEGFLGDCGAGTKVFVPASVKSLGYINGNGNNDQIVYLFASNLDLNDVETDIKTLYVLPQYYGYYAKQLKECDSEARLREMPEDMMNTYTAMPEEKKAVHQPIKEEKKEQLKPSVLTPPSKMEFEQFDESENDALFDHGFRFAQLPECGETVYDIVILEDSDLYLRKTNDNRYYRFYMYSPGQLCVDKDFRAYSKVEHTEFDLARYFKDYENDETEGDSEYDVDKKLFYGVTVNEKAKPQEYLPLDWEFVQFDEEENEFLGKHGFTYPRDTDVIYDIVQHECGELFLSRTNNGHYFRIDPFNTGRLQIDADLQAYCLTEIKPFDFDRFCIDYENDEVEDLEEYTIEDAQTIYNSVGNIPISKPDIDSTPENKNESASLFSERLEAMIAAALQDGVLTDKERELLKKRAEKEGEDWDEVEMIIEARLAEMKPAAPAVQIPRKDLKVAVKKSTPNPKILKIPEGVKVIKQGDYDCSKYEEILFPSSLETIDTWAFGESENLKRIDLSNCSQLKTIGDNAFYSCEKLEYVILPSSLETLGDSCFNGCHNLTMIDFSRCDKLEEIGDCVTFECDKLQIVDLSKCTSLEDIDDLVFLGKEIIYPAKIAIEKAENYKGKSDDEEQEHIIVPEGVMGLAKYAFADFKMKGITLPSTLRIIRKNSFCICSNLRNLDIPDNVEIIGENAFDDCKELKTIVMPAALKEIHAPLGSHMEQLKKVDFSKVTQLKLIPKTLFDFGCDKLKELVIPQGVVEIEHDAFLNLTYLKKLFLPPSLTTMGDFDRYSDSPSYKMTVYCYSPHLEELEPLVYGWDDDEDDDYEDMDEEDMRELGIESGKKNQIKTTLYVLPQYVDAYTAQRDAEGIPDVVLPILAIPDELLYYYDN